MLQGWQNHSLQNQVAGVPGLASMRSSAPTIATAPRYHNHLITHSPSCWLLCDPQVLYYFFKLQSICAFSFWVIHIFVCFFNKDFPQNVFKIPIILNWVIFLYLSGGPKPPTLPPREAQPRKKLWRQNEADTPPTGNPLNNRRKNYRNTGSVEWNSRTSKRKVTCHHQVF